MINNISNNGKRAVESFIVASQDQALANTVLGADARVTDVTTGAFQAADKQIVITSASLMGTRKPHTTLAAGDTIANAPVIEIMQGTADSANPQQAHFNTPYPLSARPYETTRDIEGSRWTTCTKQVPVTGSNSLTIVGDTTTVATAGITTQDTTEYSLTLAYRGREMDEFYSAQGTPAQVVSYTTPNYSALGTAEPVDHLIQNLAFEVNRNSFILTNYRTGYAGNEPVIAMAIDLTGAGGTAVAGLAAGTFLPIVNSVNGIRGITLTDEDVNTLANLPAGSSILTIDTTTAGTATGGVASAIAILALDRKLAYDDKVPQTKFRIDVGLRKGFEYPTVGVDVLSFANEGQGKGRILDLQYRATQGQRKYSLDHTLDPVIEYPSPVDVTVNDYVVYTLRSQSVASLDQASLSVSPKKARILIPATDVTTIGEFEALLNPWLISGGSQGIVEIN